MRLHAASLSAPFWVLKTFASRSALATAATVTTTATLTATATTSSGNAQLAPSERDVIFNSFAIKS